MIYATHKLYDCQHRVTTYRVVETKDGIVAEVYNFECEKHSMQWYDAIVLSSKNIIDCYFTAFSDILECLDCNDKNTPLYAYGVTYDFDGVLLSRLK